MLGGYTTFSAFSLDAALLYDAASWDWRRSTFSPPWRSRSRLFAGLALVRNFSETTGGTPIPPGQIGVGSSRFSWGG